MKVRVKMSEYEALRPVGGLLNKLRYSSFIVTGMLRQPENNEDWFLFSITDVKEGDNAHWAPLSGFIMAVKKAGVSKAIRVDGEHIEINFDKVLFEQNAKVLTAKAA